MVPYCVYTADLRRIVDELPAGRAEVLFYSGSDHAVGSHNFNLKNSLGSYRGSLLGKKTLR
jgi:hypothetical protein